MKFLFQKKPDRRGIAGQSWTKFCWAKDRNNVHFRLQKKLQREVKPIKFTQGLHKTEGVTRTPGRNIFP